MSRRSLRRLGIGFLALAVMLAGGYSIYWYRLAAVVSDAVPAWAAARQAEGWAVSHGVVTVGGFPFDLQATVPSPRVETPDGVTWSAPALDAALSPLAPDRLHLSPAGRQELLVPVAGQYRAFWLEAEAAQAVVQLAVHRAEAVTLHLEKVAVGEKDVAPATMAALDVALNLPAGATAADHLAATALLTVAARDLELPAASATALGGRIGGLDLKARLLGAVPVTEALIDALSRWRDDGGTVEIERLAVRWEPLDLEVDGTVALDAELQPMAAMTSKIRGYAEAVDAFVRAGLVRPDDGRAVKLVLAIMGRSPASGGRPEISVPLSVQDQKLSVGPVVLMAVPRILWPSTEIVLPDVPTVPRVTREGELPAAPGAAGR